MWPAPSARSDRCPRCAFPRAPELDTAVDRDASKCQQLVARSIKKCQDTKLAEFEKCKKSALKAGTVASSADIEACLGPDPKGKIARACQPDSKCADKGVDLAAAFPGSCSGDAAQLSACLDRWVECRACRAVNQADRLAVDCDVFDDGLTNASCPP